MTVRTLILGEYQTNCYLVSDGNGETAVIDPGYTPEVVLTAAREQHLTVRAVLLTHAHFDHVGGVRGVAEAARCPVYVHERELSLPAWLREGLTATDFYAEGDEVAVGGLRFSVSETPGHTPGSVCLRCEKALFSGDTLFTGSCGRVDFPGGSAEEMRKSLARLAAIDENLTVYPGHGETTTLARERRSNPYIPR